MGRGASDDDERAERDAVVARYSSIWGLTPDGAPFSTRSSHLAPVVYRGRPAMLKVPRTEDERRGGSVMVWWAGRGAAPVLEHDDSGTLVLQRAEDDTALFDLAGGRGIGSATPNDDDTASRILVATAARLHAIHDEPPGSTLPLAEYFRELFRTGQQHGGFLARAATLAEQLLSDQREIDQREIVVLHGDLHHGNVLRFGADGWLAIDPKNVRGDRAFEFANIFCNPTAEVAVLPNRLERQVEVVSAAAGLEPARLLSWIVAYCGLSASWFLADGDAASAGDPLAVGRRAENALTRVRTSGALGG